MWDVKTNAAGLRRGRLSHLYDSHWQIEYRIRAAGAECMFMGFANRCYLSQGVTFHCTWVTRTSSHSSCLSPFRSDPRSDPEPGRTSEPGGSNTWTRPGSGSWIIRRLARLPLTSNHQAPESKSTVQCTEHWLSFRTKQQSFAKHFPLTQKSYLVRKRIGHYRFAALYIEGFYPRSSPLLFIQINSEVRGVWFPVIGLMTCICFVTVWLSSIWWPPERFGSINTGIPENSARRCRSLSCWPCLRNKPPPP